MSGNALAVTADTALCADSEEERGHVVHLQDSLLRELVDIRNEGLLGRGRALIDVDPLLEPYDQLLPKLFIFWFCRRLTVDGTLGHDLSRRSTETTKIIQQVMNPSKEPKSVSV